MAHMPPNTTRVKAMCLIIHDGKVLVADGDTLRSKSDARPVVPSPFYRVLGGSIDFAEKTEDAVRREIREELNAEITDLEFVTAIENIFVYAGEQGHEIAFLYKGQITDESILSQKKVHIDEPDYEFDAVWVPFEQILKGDKPLYPVFDYRSVLL